MKDANVNNEMKSFSKMQIQSYNEKKELQSQLRNQLSYTHVMCVHHHGMVCPQVVDGGDSLQIWRVAANIQNKKSWTGDKE
jgi:hypothetical protein